MPIHPNAVQCKHFKTSGMRCGSPALKDHQFCFFHDRAYRNGPREFMLPLIEDPNSLHLAVQDIMRALAAQQIDTRTACALLYGCQIMQANLQRVSFSPYTGVDFKNQYADHPFPEKVTRLASSPIKPVPPLEMLTSLLAARKAAIQAAERAALHAHQSSLNDSPPNSPLNSPLNASLDKPLDSPTAISPASPALSSAGTG